MTLSPVARISLGLVSLSVLIVTVAHLFLGLFPDQAALNLRTRQHVAESFAVQLATLIEKGDRETLERTLASMRERDQQLLSAAIRRDDGRILMQAGAHQVHWKPPSMGRSTATHVIVPIRAGSQYWGGIELAYRSLDETGWRAYAAHPLVKIIALLSVPGLIACYLYLRRALQYLDPTSVIPERVRLAFDGLTEGLLVLDTQGRIVLANSAFERLQPNAQNLAGRRAADLAWMKATGEDYPWLVAIRSKTPVSGQTLQIPQSQAEAKRVIVNANPLLDGRGQARGCLVTFDDVSELHQVNSKLRNALSEIELSREQIAEQNKELEKLAHYDPMTGCLNRRAFFAKARQLFARAKSTGGELCCIMADIDHFKSINDRFGHSVGDDVIIAAAQTLQSALRKDDLLCRYGGEEFCLALPGVSLTQAEEVAERLRELIEERVGANLGNVHALKVTSSLGLSSSLLGADALETLIEQADQALYHSKKNGRNRASRYDQVSQASAVANS